LVDRRIARRVDCDRDRVDLRDSLYLPDRTGRRRFADLVLVRPAAAATGLMLFEVKLGAVNQPDRDGVSEIRDRYRPVPRRRSRRRWPIQSYVVARAFDRSLAKAAAATLSCSSGSTDRGRASSSGQLEGDPDG
jgi:hypothetical protein